MTGILARIAGIACLLLVVSACTGTDSSLGVGRQQDDAQAAANAQFPNIDSGTAVPGAVTSASSPSATGEIARVYFAPIVGAPVDMVNALAQSLGPVAGANGVRLIPGGAAGMTHEIKGYFSAFTENGSITVIHVWDVIVPGGQRVHRIQGQETVPGDPADPWASVTPATMQAIANKVVTEFAAWVRSGA